MKIVEMASAFLPRDGQVLLLKRSPHDKFADYYERPRGKVDPGETPEAACVREVHEETGLDVRVLEQYHSQWSGGDDARYHDNSYLVELCGALNITLSPDHVDYAWVQPEELDSYLILDREREGIRRGFTLVG